MFAHHGNADLTEAEPDPADDGAEAVSAPPDPPPAVRRRSAGPRGQRRSRSRRRVLAAVAVGLSVLTLVLVGLTPAVRTVLRQSFTRQPASYTELYFSGTPAVSGILLTVPVTVANHATGAKSFVLKVWMTDAVGRTDTTTSITVTPQHGEATTVVKVSVQLPDGAQVLWIGLAGQAQTLHYRIAGAAVPSPSASPTASAHG